MRAEKHRVNIISTNPDAQRLIKELNRLKLKVQGNGDYEGRFLFPVFTSISRITPIAPENIVPTAISFTEEKRDDWHSPRVAREILGQAMDYQSPFTRLITTMLDQPGAESEEGFRILNEDLRRLRPEPAIFNDSRFEEWWFKFLLALRICHFIAFRAAFDHGETSKEAKNLLEIADGQMEAFKATLTSFDIADLPFYLRFADLNDQSRAVTQGDTHQPFYEREEQKSDLAKLILPRLKKMQKQREALEKSLDGEDRLTWTRLQTGWSWKEIQDVLTVLPTLGSRFVIAHAIAALGVNLSELSPQEISDEIKLDPDNIVFLLGWNVKTLVEESKAKEKYPPILELSKKTVKLPGVLVPGEYLPLPAMFLLNKAREICSKDGFRKLIGDVHALVQSKQELTTPWLLTLLSLKSSHPQLEELVNDTLAEWKNLPEEVRDVLLNKKAGKITLNSQGKLKVKAEPIPPSPESLEVYPKPPEKKRENKAVKVQEVLVLPFLGEVGLVGNEEIRALLLDSGITVNGDKLLENFARLETVWHWKDTRRRERHLLYLFNLNPQDKNFEEAKRLFGISAVYIEQDKFIFVLDKERLSTQIDGRSLPVGFQGKLDETGQLHILGTDDSFLGEPGQLFLNNLALELTTQSFYNWGANKERDHEAKRVAHEIVSSWNELMRNSLPKIELNLEQNNQNSFCLPIRLAGYKEPVLVCEHSKVS